MTDNEVAINVEGVSKTFRIPHEKITTLKGAFVSALKSHSSEEFKALDDVSFEVKNGEFFGIIGRNGSGKSTLLKILAGIYKPDKGKVKINGLISPFLELGIGFNPELSGRDNIYLNATVLGLTHKQIEEKFDDIVEFSELRRFIDQKVKNYSSGMQVRLAFSVAIHANREILLMDEVLAVGDSNFQSKCMIEFNKYREMGKTIILVTHNVSIAQQYCDRLMLLREGKIVSVGKAKNVGDAYLYQNIDDEENRMRSESSEKSGSSDNITDKRKVAELGAIEFLNIKGERKKIFKTGENILIKINFRVNKMQDVFNFGVGLFDEKNSYMMGINSVVDKVDTRHYVKRGFAQILLRNIPFREGRYYIKVSIVKDNFNVPYDAIFQSDFFTVISIDNSREGIIEMDYEWDKLSN